MALSSAVCRHLHICLAGTPTVLTCLVGSLRADSDFWDFRLSPERFTAREVIAHIADWNEIFDARLSKTLLEDHPAIVAMDEDQLAIDHDYAGQDPVVALKRFCESREAFVQKVAALDDGAWSKSAYRADMGDVSVADQVILVAIHDSYHQLQIAEYLKQWRDR